MSTPDSTKLKETTVDVERWMESGTHISSTDRSDSGEYRDTTGVEGENGAHGQTNGGGEEAKDGDGQVKEADGRVWHRDMEARVERCEELAIETGGYWETMREWAKEGDGKVENGVVRFLIKGRWQPVPHEYWAWEPLVQRATLQLCHLLICNPHFDCSVEWHSKVSWEYRYLDWIPKLICTPTQIKGSHVSMLSSHPDSERSPLGALMPPELFPLVYGWIDPKLARKCRFVCRHWEEQCRERAFKKIDLGLSNKKMADLVRFKFNPAWRHIAFLVEELENIPHYTKGSKEPWMHHLDPHWRDWIVIMGPFPGHQTIRSVHFDLPQTLPSSFSRGVQNLRLHNVNFRRFEDTIHLVSGLPNLENLQLLDGVRWGSLTTDLPHRRPHIKHSKLESVHFTACTVGEASESSWFLFSSFTLFPHVYPDSSLFSVDLVVTLEAILHVLENSGFGNYYTIHTSKGVANGFVDTFDFRRDRMPLLEFFSPRSNSTANEMISVLICLWGEGFMGTDYSSQEWEMLNTAIGSLPQQIQFVFGFDYRERMLGFAAAGADDKLTSLSLRGGVRYAMAREEKRAEDDWVTKHWYKASLESDKVHGKGINEWWKLYP